MNNSKHILHHLLKYLDVPFTKYYLNQITSTKPESNSLIGISSILKNNYNVSNISLSIAQNDIFKLDVPFIASLNLPMAPVVVVTDVQQTRISYIYKDVAHSESLEHFFPKWEGVVLLAEKESDSREKNYWKNIQKGWINSLHLPFILTLILGFLAYFSRENLAYLIYNSFSNTILLSLYFLGVILSGLLVSQSIYKGGGIVSQVCKSQGTSGCAKILEGDASTFFGLISWSEIGFLYFSGSLISLMVVRDSTNYLFLLSLMALPYTFWSIYYQWKVARQWCPFCISIQVLIWLIFISCLSIVTSKTFAINTHQLILTAICFTASVAIIWLTLPYVKSDGELETIKVEYNKFKFSEPIVEAAFKLKEPVYMQNASGLFLGSSSPKFTISIVTDLFCPHCIEAHGHLMEVLNSFKDTLRIQIIFAIPEYSKSAGQHYNETAKQKIIYIKHLIGIFKLYSTEQVAKIYHDWYERGRKAPNKFMRSYPIQENLPLIEEELEKHVNWGKSVTISGTPTLFINQYQLPIWYKPKDLRNLLDVMIS